MASFTMNIFIYFRKSRLTPTLVANAFLFYRNLFLENIKFNYLHRKRAQ